MFLNCYVMKVVVGCAKCVKGPMKRNWQDTRDITELMETKKNISYFLHCACITLCVKCVLLPQKKSADSQRLQGRHRHTSSSRHCLFFGYCLCLIMSLYEPLCTVFFFNFYQSCISRLFFVLFHGVLERFQFFSFNESLCE